MSIIGVTYSWRSGLVGAEFPPAPLPTCEIRLIRPPFCQRRRLPMRCHMPGAAPPPPRPAPGGIVVDGWVCGLAGGWVGPSSVRRHYGRHELGALAARPCGPAIVFAAPTASPCRHGPVRRLCRTGLQLGMGAGGVQRRGRWVLHVGGAMEAVSARLRGLGMREVEASALRGKEGRGLDP